MIPILVPLALLIFLIIFTIAVWMVASKKPKKTDSTQLHNEGIYKNFEFFFTATIAIVGAIGIVKLQYGEKPYMQELLYALSILELTAMFSFSIFIILHQSSKIQRWKTVEFKELWHWQEVWMLLIMFVLASSIWLYCTGLLKPKQ